MALVFKASEIDLYGSAPYISAMSSEPLARLEARLPASVYALLKRADQLKGGTLSDFVVNAARDAAKRVIEDEGLIRLSAEDQIRFAEALLNPVEPNEALKRAARAHRQNVEAR